MTDKRTVNVALLASGSGSNAQAIAEHFKNIDSVNVIVASNIKESEALIKAEKAGLSHFHFSKNNLQSGEFLKELLQREIDYVLLCGFLLKIPAEFIEAFEGRILNIHPSLLPKFGGKGMYGMNVHESVFSSKEENSGMTIHHVTKEYDEGDVVFQATVNISDCKSAVEIAKMVLALEHEYYPRIAEAIIIKD